VMDISKELESCNAPVYFRTFNKWALKIGQSHVDLLRTLDLKDPLLLVCMIEDDRSQTAYYNEIKQFCTNKGFISQCILYSQKDFEKREKNRRSIISNIKKQIINKFGHLCWWIDIFAYAPSLKGKNVMFIGIDVYHSRKTLKKGDRVYKQRRSIGGFVSLIVRSSGEWDTCSDVVSAEARQEIMGRNNKERNDKINEILEAPSVTRDDALQRFVERVKSRLKFNPDVVIVYRDGVGDSMLDQARASEVPQIRSAVSGVKLIYAVVQKRIHTRFLVQSRDGLVGNPPAGTVVNKDVGSVQYPNFYLIPTTCTLSTTNPVNYVLITDDKPITMEELYSLTYYLCYCYPNWTDAIKLPAPTQCAHKLAYLVGESHSVDPAIDKTLFTGYWYL